MRLQVMRHAKSDWSAGVQDHDRPLNHRGERAARAMGRLLAQIGEVPDHAIASTAVRARTTLELAVSAGDWRTAVHRSDDLYATTVDATLAVVATAPDVERLMVVGHEPTWSALVRRTTGGAVRVATATVVGIDVAGDRWEDLADAGGEIVYVLQPRHFTSA